jgi:hypothetical protein
MAAAPSSSPSSSSTSPPLTWQQTLALPSSYTLLQTLASHGVCRRCSLRYIGVRDSEPYRLEDAQLSVALSSDTTIIGSNTAVEFKDGNSDTISLTSSFL